MRPNTGRPCAFLIGSLVSVPTHTAVDTDGVKPTIQASLFWFVQRRVLHGAGLAGLGAPARDGDLRRTTGTSFIDSVTLRATGCGTACSPVAVPWS